MAFFAILIRESIESILTLGNLVVEAEDREEADTKIREVMKMKDRKKFQLVGDIKGPFETWFEAKCSSGNRNL